MRGILNVKKAFFPTDNRLGFPDLDPVTDIVQDVIWYTWDIRSKCAVYGDAGICFYCDDFKFESLWNNPEKYVDLLRSFRYVVQPDFSLFYDMPQALQIFNKFRSHWVASVLSIHGVHCIPNINPSTSDCWDWSFDGFPQHSVVAFSDIGSFQSRSDRRVLLSGYEAMLKRLDPLQILWFTRNPDNVPLECTPVVLAFRR